MENKRINFVGASGTGKTTLATWISEKYNIPFISGSYSDLVPETKDIKHADMMDQNPEKIYRDDFQLLNLRAKAFSLRNNPTYVSDRSYIDSIAYLIYKLSKSMPSCDIESFIRTASNLLERDTTNLIFIPYTPMMLETWKIEDNNKRVLNRYFQFMISNIMEGVITKLYPYKEGFFNKKEICTWSSDIKELFLTSDDLQERKKQIEKFLK
jgi:hypothetical protein